MPKHIKKKCQIKKDLYIVTDLDSNYRYVVLAESYDSAVEIVKRKTGHDFDWTAQLADNNAVWQ